MYDSLTKAQHLLFVSLSVRRAGIKRPEGSTLTTENIRHLLLVHLNCSTELPFLLFDVIQRLVNIILLPFGGQNMAVQSRKLQDSITSDLYRGKM